MAFLLLSLPLLLLLLLLSLSTSTVLNPTARQEATEKASRLQGTTFQPIPGIKCPSGDVTFGSVQGTDGLSAAVEGVIPFSEITIKGGTCGNGRPNDRILLMEYYQILNRYEDAIPDLEEATQSIFMAGIDEATLECEEFVSSAPEGAGYIFSDNIGSLLPSLGVLGYAETISESEMESGRIWMAIFPAPGVDQDEICLFKEVGIFVETTPEPTPEEQSDEVEDPPLEEGEPPAEDVDNVAGNPDNPFENAENAAIEAETDLEPDSKCFPADASVLLENGVLTNMEHLQIGDRVLVAKGVFSEVLMFTHNLQHGKYTFLKMVLESGETISLSPAHFIYVNDLLVKAELAVIGDALQLADGSKSSIFSIDKVRSRGLYNPQTVHGDIIVNNIRVSTYTDTVQPQIAHALLSPVRALLSGVGISMAHFQIPVDKMACLVA